MPDWLERTYMLLGQEAMDKLQNARVALLGLGGVGGAAAEALCRIGIGHMLLVDHDVISATNINRQLLATAQNIGQSKCVAAKERLLAINPLLQLTVAETFYVPEDREFLFDYHPDIVLDAIDTVTAKLDLAQHCYQRKLPLVACLGTGNRLAPFGLQIGDIADTAGSACGLARAMRSELRKRQVPKYKVVYCQRPPLVPTAMPETQFGRHAPASAAFMPASAGFMLAYAAVDALLTP